MRLNLPRMIVIVLASLITILVIAVPPPRDGTPEPCEPPYTTSAFKRGELVRHIPSQEEVRVVDYSRHRRYFQDACGGFPATTYRVRFFDGAETHIKREYLER